jgi:hypothetical protein
MDSGKAEVFPHASGSDLKDYFEAHVVPWQS